MMGPGQTMGLPPGGLAGIAPAPRLGPTGPAAPPSPNLGSQAAALAAVQQAVTLLSMQLPSFPVGSDQQKVVMDAIKKLSEIAPADTGAGGVGMSSIQKLQEEATKSALLQKLLNSPPSAGGAPPPSGPPGTLPGMI